MATFDGSTHEGSKRRKKAYIAGGGINRMKQHLAGAQGNVQGCKKRQHDTDMAIASWFYEAGIPLSAMNSPFFQAAMENLATVGHGYKAPTYHALRINLLKDAKTQVKLLIDSFQQYWVDFGCTIMVDGWIDSKQRPLINFLVYCSGGISFIKSVDASNVVTNAENLCNLFGDIVELVGPDNVVHMVTSNGANYKAAGIKLSERYPFIQWSPCAVHCLNLIIRDIAAMPNVRSALSSASKITVFIYNHKWILNWLRKRAGWTEVVCPGATRFETSFITLKSLLDHKNHLQSLVVCDDFKKFLEIPKGKMVKNLVLNERFWNDSLIIVRVMTPLIRLLRICDSDEKPSMGYVYEGMYRARIGIKDLFKQRKQLYKPYTTIIKNRWDRMLRQNLHAAAYWLNPAFQYDRANLCRKPEVMRAVCDVIDNQKLYNKQKLVDESVVFQTRLKTFSRDLAIDCCKTLKPADWWRTFGFDVPNLQKLAVRILSQTASSYGCERNWSVFERLHTKKRNRLEHQRLNDLVYVHYNLRLQNRSKSNNRSYDPIDYESIYKTEFWIAEEQQEELDIDELENMIEEHPRIGEESFSIPLEVNEEDELMIPDEDNEIDNEDDDDDDDSRDNETDDDDDDSWDDDGS